MKKTRTLLSLLLSLLFVTVLTGCTTAKGETAPKLDEAAAIDLVWNYEIHLVGAVIDADPYKFVTGDEKLWVDQYIQRKLKGEKVRIGWKATGAYVKLTKATEREAEVVLEWQEPDGWTKATLKLQPVNGEWKIATHTTPDGKWWKAPKDDK